MMKKPTTEQILYKIGLRSRLYNESKKSEENIDQLSARDLLILELLDEEKETTIGELAEKFPGSSQSTISQYITNLYKKGYVDKIIKIENQKKRYVTLKPEGKRVLKKIKKEEFELYSNFKKTLDLTPEEEEIFNKVADKTLTFLDNAMPKSEEI